MGGAGEWWDNNGGRNYRIGFRRDHLRQGKSRSGTERDDGDTPRMESAAQFCEDAGPHGDTGLLGQPHVNAGMREATVPTAALGASSLGSFHSAYKAFVKGWCFAENDNSGMERVHVLRQGQTV
ncbi:hypothetical protein DFH06DRAFT_1151362 [Mycena polygramma]|nr:hypothetical protein DFH06DRAFT_1151362 [Mycena polygramma]